MPSIPFTIPGVLARKAYLPIILTAPGGNNRRTMRGLVKIRGTLILRRSFANDLTKCIEMVTAPHPSSCPKVLKSLPSHIVWNVLGTSRPMFFLGRGHIIGG